MHNKLRYQAKTHAISEKLSKEKKKKKKFRIFSPIFFFFLLKINKQKNNKDMLMEKEMTYNPSM
jgi:hypothetical protein